MTDSEVRELVHRWQAQRTPVRPTRARRGDPSPTEDTHAITLALLRDFSLRVWKGRGHCAETLSWLAGVFGDVLEGADAHGALLLKPFASKKGRRKWAQHDDLEVSAALEALVRLGKKDRLTKTAAVQVVADATGRDESSVWRAARDQPVGRAPKELLLAIADAVLAGCRAEARAHPYKYGAPTCKVLAK